MSQPFCLMAANLGGLIARQQTEAALRWSESRFQKMAANIPGMIFQFLRRPDSSESVLFASSGWELFEVEPAETQANFSQLKALIHPDDRQAYEQSVAVSAATPTTLDLGRRIVTLLPTQVAACASAQSSSPMETSSGMAWTLLSASKRAGPASSRSGNASERIGV